MTRSFSWEEFETIMSFELSQIDRAIEWAVKDEIIGQGFWPDERTFRKNKDVQGLDDAFDRIDTPIKVFGVGEYQDRKQLLENNVIIERVYIHEGIMTEPLKFYFTMADLLGINPTNREKEGVYSVEYEVRFVCKGTGLDRKINQLIFNAFEDKIFLNGLIDKTLERTTEGFWVYLQRKPIHLAGRNNIERLWRLMVSEVKLEPIEMKDLPSC